MSFFKSFFSNLSKYLQFIKSFFLKKSAQFFGYLSSESFLKVIKKIIFLLWKLTKYLFFSLSFVCILFTLFSAILIASLLSINPYKKETQKDNYYNYKPESYQEFQERQRLIEIKQQTEKQRLENECPEINFSSKEDPKIRTTGNKPVLISNFVSSLTYYLDRNPIADFSAEDKNISITMSSRLHSGVRIECLGNLKNVNWDKTTKNYYEHYYLHKERKKFLDFNRDVKINWKTYLRCAVVKALPNFAPEDFHWKNIFNEYYWSTRNYTYTNNEQVRYCLDIDYPSYYTKGYIQEIPFLDEKFREKINQDTIYRTIFMNKYNLLNDEEFYLVTMFSFEDKNGITYYLRFDPNLVDYYTRNYNLEIGLKEK